MFQRTLYILFLLCFSASTLAQIIEKIEPENIKTIQFNSTAAREGGIPIIRKGEPLRMSFDDIKGDEEDYYYQITHHNFDWTLSDLSKGEYLDGFDDVRIETYENSLNSLQIYSHYMLNIPNRETRGLRKSGNYMVSMFNYDGDLVFTRKFMIVERKVSVAVEVKRSRNLEHIDTKQSVQFTIDSPSELLINPKQNVKVLVLQNGNIKNAITNLKPQYTIGSELIYRYDKEASFWAGNEFYNFDSKELQGTNIGIRRVALADIYEHFLYTQISRAERPYTYNPDINGNFLVRSLRAERGGNNRTNIEAEYIRMYFNLKYYEDLRDDQEIHIYGNFNNWCIDESTYMKYNKESDSFTNARLFKQGFYNYRFVVVDGEGNIDQGVIGGNFWQTENNYDVIVYYRAPGARFDRVIGYGKANSTVISNN